VADQELTPGAADGYPRSSQPWTAEEESAMVNGYDDGWSIAALGSLLRRHPAVVRERLHLFGRLPACDPLRAEEDRRLADAAHAGGQPPARGGEPGEVASRGAGFLGRRLRWFLRR
jgi:hypothetical protein